jgi:hypothetical protein
VAAVWGTHTHVPTADARILPGGTAYITDVGMCGAYDSVIGFDKEVIVGKFLRQTSVRFEVARAPGHLSAALIDIDYATKKATAIRHLMVPAL